MRVKRARKVRKYLRYYRTCHGFRAPYKVRLATPSLRTAEPSPRSRISSGGRRRSPSKGSSAEPRGTRVPGSCQRRLALPRRPQTRGPSRATRGLGMSAP